MRLLVLPVIAFILFSFIPKKTEALAERVLLIRVDEIGIVTDNMDTITSEELSEYISTRLFKSFQGTGKMYDVIKIEKIHDGPMDPVMDVILKEIALGQKKALADFCLFRYKRGFENLKSKQQKAIRKKFPVLFQTTYD